MEPYFAISSKTYDNKKIAQRTSSQRTKRIIQYTVGITVGIIIGVTSTISPFLALVMIFGVIYLIMAYEKPILLCYLIVASIGLTSGIERGRIVPLLAPNEVILLVVLSMIGLLIFTKEFKLVKPPPYFYWALILVAFGRFIFPIGIYLIRGTPLSTKIIFNFFAPLQYFLLYWVFLVVPKTDTERRNIIRLMIYIAMIVGMVGILQMARVGVVLNLLSTWYGSSHGSSALEYGRATSLLAGWNALGTFMMASTFLIWAYLPEENDALHKIGIIFSAIIIVSTLIITTSFASAIGLIIGIMILIRMLKRLKITLPILILLIFVALIFALMFFAVFQQFIENRLDYQYREGGVVPQTLVFRYEVWRDVFIPPILDNFPLPVWPTVPETYAWRFEESQYILLLFRNGLIGLLSFLTWLGITLGWLKNKFNKSTGYIRTVIAATTTLFIVLTIMGFTNAVFTYSGTADFSWVILALIANKGDEHES